MWVCVERLRLGGSGIVVGCLLAGVDDGWVEIRTGLLEVARP
jgi:hypothetical protein